MIIPQKHRLCILAGLFSSIGSVFCKVPTLLIGSSLFNFRERQYLYFLCYSVSWLLMVLCNLLNWRCVLKANQYWEQTLTTTIYTLASNYTITFIVSAFILNESFTFTSWLGVICLIIGVRVMCEEDQQTKRFKET